MALNIPFANRIREALADVQNVTEKNMFRGTAFMIDAKLCITVGDNRMMCRIDPAMHEQLIETKNCRTMIMKGRELKGYVLVDEDAVKNKSDLVYWVNLCLAFNKYAKSSKKKNKQKAK